MLLLFAYFAVAVARVQVLGQVNSMRRLDNYMTEDVFKKSYWAVISAGKDVDFQLNGENMTRTTIQGSAAH